MPQATSALSSLALVVLSLLALTPQLQAVTTPDPQPLSPSAPRPFSAFVPALWTNSPSASQFFNTPASSFVSRSESVLSSSSCPQRSSKATGVRGLRLGFRDKIFFWRRSKSRKTEDLRQEWQKAAEGRGAEEFGNRPTAPDSASPQPSGQKVAAEDLRGQWMPRSRKTMRNEELKDQLAQVPGAQARESLTNVDPKSADEARARRAKLFGTPQPFTTEGRSFPVDPLAAKGKKVPGSIRVDTYSRQAEQQADMERVLGKKAVERRIAEEELDKVRAEETRLREQRAEALRAEAMRTLGPKAAEVFESQDAEAPSPRQASAKGAEASEGLRAKKDGIIRRTPTKAMSSSYLPTNPSAPKTASLTLKDILKPKPERSEGAQETEELKDSQLPKNSGADRANGSGSKQLGGGKGKALGAIPVNGASPSAAKPSPSKPMATPPRSGMEAFLPKPRTNTVQPKTQSKTVGEVMQDTDTKDSKAAQFLPPKPKNGAAETPSKSAWAPSKYITKRYKDLAEKPSVQKKGRHLGPTLEDELKAASLEAQDAPTPEPGVEAVDRGLSIAELQASQGASSPSPQSPSPLAPEPGVEPVDRGLSISELKATQEADEAGSKKPASGTTAEAKTPSPLESSSSEPTTTLPAKPQAGQVARDAIEKGTSSTRFKVISATGVDIFMDPSADAEVVGSIKGFQVVTSEEEDGEWLKLKSPFTGWIKQTDAKGKAQVMRMGKMLS